MLSTIRACVFRCSLKHDTLITKTHLRFNQENDKTNPSNVTEKEQVISDRIAIYTLWTRA